MKGLGIRIEELLAEIKANFVAFFSIAMFVCLGIGLFLGIQWGGVALRNVVEDTFEAGTMHDIEVQFPYGLTEEDLTKIAATEGVTDVEPGYTSQAIMADGNERYVLKLQSLTERIDLPVTVEGTLPKAADEIALLSFWAEERGYKLGDTIVLKHDSQDKDDKDGMETLTSDRYTITALVEHPAYLSMVAGSLGVVSIGSGSVDCVGFVARDAFDLDAFDDAYPVAYVRCDDLRGMNTFTDAYGDRLAPTREALEDLGSTRAVLRYEEVRQEAQDKIDDADKEVADAEKKISDAEDEISDGAKEIADGEQELADAEQKLADGKEELEDAEGQLAEGAQKISDAEGQLAEGEEKLRDAERQYGNGKNTATKKEDEARAQLADARSQLQDAQAEYDEAKEAYEAGKKALDSVAGTYDSIRPEYDAWVNSYNDLQAQRATLYSQLDDVDAAYAAYKDIEASDTATDEEKDAAWAEVEAKYSTFSQSYDDASSTYAEFIQNGTTVAEAFAKDNDLDLNDFEFDDSVIRSLPSLPPISRDNAGSVEIATAVARESLNSAYKTIDDVASLEGEGPDGRMYSLLELPSSIENARAALADAKKELDESKEKLDSGWKEYRKNRAKLNKEVSKGKQKLSDAKREINEGKKTLSEKRSELEEGKATLAEKQAEFEEAKRTYEEKLAEFEDGKGDLAEAKKELADAKKTLEEKRGELEDAKADLLDAKEKLEDMVRYEWFVAPRLENGGANGISTIVTMMGNVRWAMALLFVLVGLFVCYSAVSRLVHDQIVQIGTKKAIGFREKEISGLYLSFSGISVLAGTIVAGIVATVIVEGIMNPASAASFTLPSFPPYFSLVELLIGGGIELVLILLSTWFAIHGMLKRNAIELLNGDPSSVAKEHFYERTKLWERLPLFTQTIINNCVNDTRRVVATLIGVMGCTALIVTAVTLSNNVSRSLDRHYNDIYHYDTLVYLNPDVDDATQAVGKTLDSLGVDSTPAHKETLQVRQADGYRSAAALYVPTDTKDFDAFYHVMTTEGDDADLLGSGIWLSEAYATHMGLDVGDTMEVTETSGEVHELKVDGIFEYRLLRNEFVMGSEAYRAEFGEAPQENVLLAQMGETDRGKVHSALVATDGYDILVEDAEQSRYAFGELSSLLQTVVMVYLLLSALMAVVVLLNLYIMFIDEKKRELIVLMINGYSTKAAKSYISRDSIALSVIGIALGLLLGSLMGRITVRALEPSYGSFIKSFNAIAAVVGIVGAGVFSMAVLIFALRRIPRFDLTDINRF